MHTMHHRIRGPHRCAKCTISNMQAMRHDVPAKRAMRLGSLTSDDRICVFRAQRAHTGRRPPPRGDGEGIAILRLPPACECELGVPSPPRPTYECETGSPRLPRLPLLFRRRGIREAIPSSSSSSSPAGKSPSTNSTSSLVHPSVARSLRNIKQSASKQDIQHIELDLNSRLF